MSYDSYINSSKWERRKVAYYAKHPKKCRACGTRDNIHLHHHTYKRMGHEIDEDLVPLCVSCHDLVHKLHRANKGWSLTRATQQFLQFQGASLRPRPSRPRPKTGHRIQQKKKTKTTKAPVPPPPPELDLETGQRIVVVTSTPTLRWANNKAATVTQVLSSTAWRVELDDMPGSSMAVVSTMVSLELA